MGKKKSEKPEPKLPKSESCLKSIDKPETPTPKSEGCV